MGDAVEHVEANPQVPFLVEVPTKAQIESLAMPENGPIHVSQRNGSAYQQILSMPPLPRRDRNALGQTVHRRFQVTLREDIGGQAQILVNDHSFRHRLGFEGHGYFRIQNLYVKRLESRGSPEKDGVPELDRVERLWRRGIAVHTQMVEPSRQQPQGVPSNPFRSQYRPSHGRMCCDVRRLGRRVRSGGAEESTGRGSGERREKRAAVHKPIIQVNP